MSRDDIIKALECCASEQDLCAECPVDKRLLEECVCGSFVMGRALGLIRELTVENGLLRCAGDLELVDYAVGKIRDAKAAAAREIFAEIESSLEYIEEQLDEAPDCFLSVKEDISFLESKYLGMGDSGGQA